MSIAVLTGGIGEGGAAALLTFTVISAVEPDDGEYEELNSSPEEDYDAEGGFEATRTLKTAWDNRLALAEKFLGRGLGEVDGQMFVILGARYPWRTDARVASVSIQPFGGAIRAADGNNLNAAYTSALLKVEYKTGKAGDPEDDGETLVEEDVEPWSEFLTIPFDRFVWQDLKEIKETEAPARLIKGFTWVYKRFKMQRLVPQMFDYIGTINGDAITSRSLQYEFAEETLLYDSIKVHRQITTLGVSQWSAEMRFIKRSHSWQKFFRAGKKDPELLYTLTPFVSESGTSSPQLAPFYPYDENDFTHIRGS